MALGVPIIAAALLAVMFLENQVMGPDTAPVKVRLLCSFASASFPVDPSVDADLEAARWALSTQECDDRETRVSSLPKRVGDIPVTGVTDADKMITCQARYLASQ
ncbi:hypothetical protein [Saccharothrix luteola]|uniref:hypothetical protein n=1 Tax=Saccharothrix luteola TaxID=2893018 RepID=UPI001E431FA8|nr:hypothetical protein [Saccharothrix luteola]MCC8250517.1 hypothetical protein [Saccharothrix luteola]